MNARTRTVAVVGLGRIGSGVSWLIAAAGHDVRVHDVRPEAETAAAEYATPMRSAAEAADGADCVLISVWDDEQVREVIEGEDGVLAASRPAPVAVVLSTVTSATIEREHALARERGVALLDCGVSGSKMIDARKKIAASAGGDRAAFDSVRPILEAFADPLVYMGGPGTGMKAKIARNMLHYCSVLADFEALALAEAAELDTDAFREFVLAADRNSGGRMGYGERGDISRAESFLNYAVKDLAAADELAAEAGVELPAAASATAFYGELLGSLAARRD